MSTDIYDHAGLMVTKLCGPAGPADRRLWQFTPPDGYAQLNCGEVLELASMLLASACQPNESVTVDYTRAPSLHRV